MSESNLSFSFLAWMHKSTPLMCTTDRSYFNMSLWEIFALSPRKLSFAFKEIQDEFSLRKATTSKSTFSLLEHCYFNQANGLHYKVWHWPVVLSDIFQVKPFIRASEVLTDSHWLRRVRIAITGISILFSPCKSYAVECWSRTELSLFLPFLRGKPLGSNRWISGSKYRHRSHFNKDQYFTESAL